MQPEGEKIKQQDTLQSEQFKLGDPLQTNPNKKFKVALIIVSVCLIAFIGATIGLAIAYDQKDDELETQLSYSSWTKLIPDQNPHARLAHVALKIDETKMLIFGGLYGHPKNPSYDSATKTTSFQDMWIFDTDDNQWTEVEQKGTQPSKRFHTSLSKVGNKLYLFGGFNNFIDYGDEHQALADFFEFDLDSYTWTKITANNAPSARGAHETVAYENKIYLFGGSDHITKGTKTKDLYVYDISTNTWTDKTASVPDDLKGRHGFGMVRNDHLAYIFGGASNEGEGDISKMHNDFWQLNLKTFSFTEQDPEGNIPKARLATDAATTIYGHLFMFGGLFQVTEENDTQVLNDMWMYDVDSNKWYELYTSWKESLKPRFGQSVTEVDNKIIVFGGRIDSLTHNGSNAIWQYIPPKFVSEDASNSSEKE